MKDIVITIYYGKHSVDDNGKHTMETELMKQVMLTAEDPLLSGGEAGSLVAKAVGEMKADRDRDEQRKPTETVQ